MANSNPVDFLQEAWIHPESAEIFRNDQVLIIPDIKPAVPGQLLVVYFKPSWNVMDPSDISYLYTVAQLVCNEIEEGYRPTRGTGLVRFGNDSPTPHVICYPRNSVEDGALLHDKNRPKAAPSGLAETQHLMQAQFERSGFAINIQKLGRLSLS